MIIGVGIKKIFLFFSLISVFLNCTAKYFRIFDIESLPDSGFVCVAERNDSLFKMLCRKGECMQFKNDIRKDSIYDVDLHLEYSPSYRAGASIASGFLFRGLDGIDVDARFHWSLYSVEKISSVKDDVKTYDSSIKRIGSFLIDRRDSSVVYHFSGDSLVVIPNGVKHISSFVFSGDTCLKRVIIPETVISIGDYAFESCWRLSSISMSNNIKRIGRNSFENCANLVDFSMPMRIETIEYKAFSNCLGIREVVLPNTLTQLQQKKLFSRKFTAIQKCNLLIYNASLKAKSPKMRL